VAVIDRFIANYNLFCKINSETERGNMNQSTCIEIFSNPEDLEFIITQDTTSKKFAIAVCRGPGHNYKPLLSSTPFAGDPEEAAQSIKDILVTIRAHCNKELANKNSFISQILNPDSREIDDSEVLNDELIAHIVDELRVHQTASTHKMLPAAR